MLAIYFKAVSMAEANPDFKFNDILNGEAWAMLFTRRDEFIKPFLRRSFGTENAKDLNFGFIDQFLLSWALNGKYSISMPTTADSEKRTIELDFGLFQHSIIF